MTVSISGTDGLTFNDATTQNTSAFYGGLAFRNRIINGAMVINQRATSITASAYSVDRFEYVGSVASKATISQDTSVYPAGFRASLKAVSSSAYTVGASEVFMVRQAIEGFNTADLDWGTANAKTITISFLAYSSLTGTFGGAVENSDGNRCYVFSYSIPTANTWTQVSVTIAGDTSGTWLTTNGIGLRVAFSFGTGASLSGTAGSWGTTRLFAPTGAVSVVGTSGATFYITGVQLEKGSTATSFDYRPYGTELVLCQRYFESQYFRDSGYGNGSNGIIFTVPLKATKRSAPTVTFGADPDSWTINFPSPSANSYNADTLGINTGSAPTAGLSRYGSILSISAEL